MLRKIALLSIFLPLSLQAASKLLVCDLTDPSALNHEVDPATDFSSIKLSSLPIGYWLRFKYEISKLYDEECEKGGIGSKAFCVRGEKTKREITFAERNLEHCANSEFLVRYEFLLNTEHLDQSGYSSVEFTPESCGLPYHIKTMEAAMSSTSSVIKFIGASSERPFMVDRVTLKAGYNTARIFNCRVEEVKLKNQI